MSTLKDLAAAQACIVGITLIGAGLLKAWALRRPTVDRTVLAAWLPGSWVRPGWAAIVAVELIIGALLVSGALAPFTAAAAVGFFVGAMALLAITRSRDPTASCGCMGAGRQDPIGPIALVRAGLLATMSTGAIFAPDSLWARFAHPTCAVATCLGWILIGMVSPELRSPRSERPDWARSRSLKKAVRLARESPAFAILREQLVSTIPTDAWRDDDDGSRVVLFTLRPDSTGAERFLAFAVEPRANAILRFGELQLRPTMDGWKASHHAVGNGIARPTSGVPPTDRTKRSPSSAIPSDTLAVWHSRTS